MRRTTHHPRPAWLRALRTFLATYVVVAIIGAIISLIGSSIGPSFSTDNDFSSASEDLTGSISRFNQDSDSEDPSWTQDDFAAAVAGITSGGQIVRMPGSDTYLDDGAIDEIIAGTKVLVVVTAPTPLGAVEKTRVRDNTVQKYWAQQRGIALVMVHGQEAYLPGPDLFVMSTPSTGLPMREGMRTGDATSTVEYVAKEAIAYKPGTTEYQEVTQATSDATTAKELALTDTRAPTPAELAPITAAFDAGNLYVDPTITPRPAYNKAWDAIAPGKTLKVAILPYAEPGTAVDYTAALAKRYPDDAILVMTGKWIESTGVDRQIMIDSMIQADGLGGFAYSASAPQYEAILDWVTDIAGSAVQSHAFDRPLPTLPDTGFPRWASYLLLATSLIIAAGFGVEYLLDRRTPPDGQSRQRWRDHIASGLSASYLRLSTAPYLGADGDLSGPPHARKLLDGAYADLIKLHGIDVDRQATLAEQTALAAWDALDAAARELDDPGSGPSQRLATALRAVPPPPRAPRGSFFAFVKGKLRARLRRADKVKLVWRVVVVTLVLVVLGYLVSTLYSIGHTSIYKEVNVDALATSNVMPVGDVSQKDITAMRRDIGNRAMLVAVADSSMKTNAYDLADSMVRAYPDAVAFVLEDGDVKTAAVGAAARVGKYNDYSLIDDYYGLQNTAAGNEPVVRQLALLYDQLTAEHSIARINRDTYDPPSPPWEWITAALVLTLGATAWIVSAATRRTTLRERARNDERATRESLSLRLGSVAPALLNAGPSADQSMLAKLGSEDAALMDRISTAEPDQFDTLRDQIDAFTARVDSLVAL